MSISPSSGQIYWDLGGVNQFRVLVEGRNLLLKHTACAVIVLYIVPVSREQKIGGYAYDRHTKEKDYVEALSGKKCFNSVAEALFISHFVTS